MLAGILDPDAARDPSSSVKRLAGAFGNKVAARAITAGPLTIVADLISGPDDATTTGCAVEGPIYNLRALAAELGTDPDAGAAVVLREAYQRWGEDVVHRLRGAFALAAWSPDGRRALLAQDQVGIGAIFVHDVGRELVFASEIRDLLPLLRQRPDPDEVGVVQNLAGAFVFDRRTLYRDVRRIGAGRRLAIRDGIRTEETYWEPRYEPPFDAPRLDVAVELRAALLRALEQRVSEPDKVGVMLSGGFDSSSVAAAAAAVRDPQRAPVRGYSASFPDDPELDETDLLDALCRHLRVENVRFRILPGGAVTLALAYTRDWSLPLSGPGWVIEYALTRRAAADGVTVLLDGLGGDEIFGFSPYLLTDLLRRGRLLSMFEFARRGTPGIGKRKSWRQAARIVRNFGLNPSAPGLYRTLQRLRESQSDAPEWLSASGAGLLAQAPDPLGEMRWAKGSGEPRWWQFLAFTLTEVRESYGMGDHARQRAAWVGLEARPPLADVDLIETALRIPPEYAWEQDYNRPFAREAMAGLLPDEVRLSRRKSNLAPLYNAGLTGPDLPLVRRLLMSKAAETRRWVRPDVIGGMLDNPPTAWEPGWYAWMNAVWYAVSVECWLQTELDPAFPSRLLEEEAFQEPEYVELATP
jgi:asparagine synthase (glutamine-hydrolysing)